MSGEFTKWTSCTGQALPTGENCTDGVDNDCNGLTDCKDPACAQDASCLAQACTPQTTEPCYDGPPGTASVGICKTGTLTCGANGVWIQTCVGEVLPQPAEDCTNGVDDNCNGLIDCLDPSCAAMPQCCAPGTSRACYDGPSGTEAVGVCKGGNELCLTAGSWSGACLGEVVPSGEVCNDGLDDDCNGLTDCLDPACVGATGCCQPSHYLTCYDGPPGTKGVGVCKSGRDYCNSTSNTWKPGCAGEVVPSAEICGDGLDNDCNGLADCADPACYMAAGCCTPSSTRSCYPGPGGTEGVGVCAAGTETCSASGTPGKCTGAVVPSTEVCGDGLDNNCNGLTDCADPACAGKGTCCAAGATQSCYTGPAGTSGVGRCKAGTATCDSTTGSFGTCVGQVLPSTENCSDGIDNDCNGQTDCADPACSLNAACNACHPDAGCVCAGAATDGSTCPMGFTEGFGASGADQCCPCTTATCSTDPSCCATAPCAGTASCPSSCTPLAPACGGRVDTDCDDFPEDCDEPCCPCEAPGTCP
jgi:hypothetical protein